MEAPAIVHSEERFLAVFKPAGMLVHHVHLKSGEATRDTLVDWLLPQFPELRRVGDEPAMRPGIVHRLDKDTSGIMLVPRTQEYFLYLKSLFAGREVEKTYLALVHGRTEKKGTIELPIGIRPGTTRRTVRGGKMAKEARTDYELTRTIGECSLLSVRPRTGRTHQIRVHLAAAGHPIVGDRMYGKKKEVPWATRLMLHAYAIEFAADPGKRLRLAAEPDAEFEAVLEAAGE